MTALREDAYLPCRTHRDAGSGYAPPPLAVNLAEASLEAYPEPAGFMAMTRDGRSDVGLRRSAAGAVVVAGLLLISRPVVSVDGDNSHWTAFGTPSERGTSDIVTTLTSFGGKLTAGGFFYFAGRE
jgi:hypothetical protein